MEALGGVLDTEDPTKALIAHRMGKGEKVYYRYKKRFDGKASVGLKLEAYGALVRNCDLFLSNVVHWNASSLQEALRWERNML